MKADSRLSALRTRRDFLQAQGVLVVTRDPPPPPLPAPGQPPIIPANPEEGVEVLLSVWDDGQVIALNGHVDLGTGIRTALAQIVAEELDVAMAQVEMVLGDTARAPNQGPTIASASIQIHAVPLRQAAAQARAFLMARAAERLAVPPAQLMVEQGVVRSRDDTALRVSYGDLLQGQRVTLRLDGGAPLKPVSEYRVVGQSQPRVDIPAKVFGELSFVHDMRVPGMLHGRVVRPPYAGADHGDFIGNTLESVDESSIAHIPGVRAVVVIRDFVGVVAEREEQAEQAAAQLQVRWRDWPGLPPLADLGQALRANPATPRRLVDEGDVEGALAGAAQSMPRSYTWPYQMHASIGPSCALALWHGEPAGSHALTVYAGTQNPHVLRADLARLLRLADTSVEVVRMEAAGCYGRNCADDVAADAALLARAVGAPVRVQLTREQEHLWEPKGAAQWMEVRGGLRSDGSIAAYDFSTSYPSNGAPTLALLLTRSIEPKAQAFEMGDRTARPPYEIDNLRVTVNDMPPILRASWLRGVSALPNSFAHESYIDELATAAEVDPVEYRLRHLKDPRAHELLQATAERAGWLPHTRPQQQGASGDWLHGQGVAYARYVHSKWPGFGAAWAAWVADVDVNKVTGEVHVKRVVVGHDAGLMINPDGVRHQIHGNVVQTTSRALKESVRVDPLTSMVASREWGSYPILSFREVPVIEVMTMPRPDQPPLGAGESASVPGTAAIANAIFDATGVRFRQPPFTPEVVRAALHPLPPPADAPVAARRREPAARAAPEDARWPQARRWWARAGALAVGAIGLGAAVLGWRPVIAPVTRPDASVYTAETIARGRQLAAAGNCLTCHTAPGGAAYAGGRAMETPFGTVYATNLTPDVETGIGAWSFSAFQRAMREGISRDGHRLYPAFPYTAFTRITDDDLTALYAYLMAQPAVRAPVPESRLAFPFGYRPLLAMWNALFLTPGAVAQAEPARSAQWNRGAYLVNGLGHCSACHTERNALGAERSGQAFLGGAFIKGWEAPALSSASRSPVPWTEQALYRYLRFGHSAQHGVAAGPMAPVVRELGALPDEDVRAMAHYLTSFNPKVSEDQATAAAQAAVARGQAAAQGLAGPAQRMFDQACGACHHDGDGPRLLGVNVPLALNSNLHSERPDNLLRAILEGIRAPAAHDIGFMPAFKDAFDDRQVAELAGYMRQRFAPDRPAWDQLEQAVARVRATPSAP
ncbi:molybdopterin cofactor-binding domain-containing protein [Ramlibacter sp. 2FC]|uniref:molybdopterin cofactor-binding domain-containing protein n=1 Tax=Ramlibacter sp. 2FC TaxID=2502188 RepID=UPI0010F4C862|nr:molybdopterin cofactor-binding domain-containing protein [Ramlibacter sp. 2FC]